MGAKLFLGGFTLWDEMVFGLFYGVPEELSRQTFRVMACQKSVRANLLGLRGLRRAEERS